MDFDFFQTGHTALQRCAAEGHFEVAKQLISRGCPIDHQDDIVSFVFLAKTSANLRNFAQQKCIVYDPKNIPARLLKG